MIDYDDLNTNIKNWLEEIVQEDEHGLRAGTLYKNIYNSTGDEKQLSQLFEVPVGLIRAIKDLKK